jgi:cation diffusion facilitator CzcD-associated flavoprotein CzcO
LSSDFVDVVIVGAGLSGIGAAYHLQRDCPQKSYAVLEGRDCIGGTWDLFRYPGVRSDSDMYTLGYGFKPWRAKKAIADGPLILDYIRETASENGIDRNIRFNHRVVRAAWDSANGTWTVEAERGPQKENVSLRCRFLFMCSGYYRYEHGYEPAFPGAADFAGRVLHPQKWPSDIDYAGKRVVVIGSGATAVTLVPEMSKTAGHVTMLQRSPTYIVARPEVDRLRSFFQRFLPERAVPTAIRWKNVLLGMYFYQLCRRKPEKAKALILEGVRQALGPDYDVEKHFTPRYNPWQQRLCLAPDGDFFTAIRDGRASVVTDHIESFTRDGIRLKSGEKIYADIIVSATGLELVPLGNVELRVDGQAVDLSKAMVYRGMMFSDIPNFASAFGYTNASWTLKADLTCQYVCRLLNYMDRYGHTTCMPHNTDPSVMPEPYLDFTSGYVQRGIAKLAKQGNKRPWKLYQNYILDLVSLRYGALNDGVLRYRSG